jgi:hypothetical protein
MTKFTAAFTISLVFFATIAFADESVRLRICFAKFRPLPQSFPFGLNG